MKFSTVVLSIAMMATAALAVPAPAPAPAPAAAPEPKPVSKAMLELRSMLGKRQCSGCFDGEYCCYEQFTECYSC